MTIIFVTLSSIIIGLLSYYIGYFSANYYFKHKLNKDERSTKEKDAAR